MVSSRSDADIIIEALQIGAYDFIEKPVDINANLASIREELSSKILSLFKSKDIN